MSTLDNPNQRRVILTLWLLAAALLMMAGIIFLSLYEPQPPISYTEPGSISPPIVKAGDSIQVTRIYTINNDTPMRVTRALVSGDCNQRCRIYELSELSSVSNRTPGAYKTSRALNIPDELVTGEYRLVSTVRYQGFFGREYTIKSPELSFAVQ
jgi:hypothetical protein